MLLGINGTGGDSASGSKYDEEGLLRLVVDIDLGFFIRQLLVDVLPFLSPESKSSSAGTEPSLAFLPILLKLRRRDMLDRRGDGEKSSSILVPVLHPIRLQNPPFWKATTMLDDGGESRE